MSRAAIERRVAAGHRARLPAAMGAAQNAHVLLYPEGMIKLNGSAGEIMKRCDGEATIADITADLERTFSTGPVAMTSWPSSPWRSASNG
jgi:coenzyme PQQ biosynthesis protein PqqD